MTIQNRVEKAETIRDIVNLFIEFADGTKEEREELMNAYQTKMHNANQDKTAEEIEQAARSNIGYMIGYYDDETRSKVYNAYELSHPIFGNV